jgi:hypothetical protein
MTSVCSCRAQNSVVIQKYPVDPVAIQRGFGKFPIFTWFSEGLPFSAELSKGQSLKLLWNHLTTLAYRRNRWAELRGVAAAALRDFRTTTGLYCAGGMARTAGRKTLQLQGGGWGPRLSISRTEKRHIFGDNYGGMKIVKIHQHQLSPAVLSMFIRIREVGPQPVHIERYMVNHGDPPACGRKRGSTVTTIISMYFHLFGGPGCLLDLNFLLEQVQLTTGL